MSGFRVRRNRDGFYVDFDGTVVERELEYKPRRVGETYGEWEQKLSHAVLRSDQDAKMFKKIIEVIKQALNISNYQLANEVFWFYKHVKAMEQRGQRAGKGRLVLSRPCILAVLRTIVVDVVGDVEMAARIDAAMCGEGEMCWGSSRQVNKEYVKCLRLAKAYSKRLYSDTRAAARKMLNHIIGRYGSFLPEGMEDAAAKYLSSMLDKLHGVDGRIAVAVAIHLACEDLGTCVPVVLDAVYKLLRTRESIVSSYASTVRSMLAQ